MLVKIQVIAFIKIALRLLLLLAALPLSAQTQTVGLFLNDAKAFRGYTLFAPLRSTTTYLIDNDGKLVRSWQSSYQPGNSVYLLENGHLLRTGNARNQIFTSGGQGGRVQEFDWDGTLLWDFEYSSNQYLQHHDIEPLPNGNVLLIAWELKSTAEAIAAGRNPALVSSRGLWPDKIIEVKPQGANGGEIVWEWHAWDHLIQDFDASKPNYGVVADHPELVDLNFSNNNQPDWLHLNAVDYNPQLDQILLSVHNNFNELWIIDHSTTTAEAASHSGGKYGKGGDLLYRWGNPRAYKMGSANDQKFSGQHDAQWIAPGLPGAGNILIFNNGTNRRYSSVDEIIPPVEASGNYVRASGSAFGPSAATWSYVAPTPTDFYAMNISGAQRLPNGNTLICDGPHGIFFEVTAAKEVVWKYINPVVTNGPMTQGDPIPSGQQGQENNVFRSPRYAPDFPGLAGKNLTPGDPIEKYPMTAVDEFINAIPAAFQLYQNYPNPFNPSTIIRFSLPQTSTSSVESREQVTLKVFDALGREVATLVEGEMNAGERSVAFDAKELPSGVYLYRLQTGLLVQQKKMVVTK
ncbi:MAG: aryl-sulfate sulfotransferase [candidate division KSB1 bacterium]|nr:aryl-sulfate sulfotransferase [candidate division KSB1 bacterium]MDZ7367156.1 aryl-sulfate sulfotransferase [candidate division KSB1 bacterium]